MKTLLILNLFIHFNLFMNLLLILNYLYLNIFEAPLKQLIYLIFYMIFMSVNILILKQDISLNIFILLIIFISGILILFSYFICLINNLMKKNNYWIILFLNLFLSLIMMYLINSQLNFILKIYNFNFKKNKIFNIKKLYSNFNLIILIMMIIFLMVMLIIMSKICLIEYKNLRVKKWKK